MAPNSPILGSQARQNIVGGGNIYQGVGGAGAIPVMGQPFATMDDIRRIEESVNNSTNQTVESLNILSQGFQGLETQILQLSLGINGIVPLIQQDTDEQRRILLEQQERERVLAEANVRRGKEDQIESKVSFAFDKAARPLTAKVRGLFDRISEAIMYLMGGWLAVNVSKLLEAQENENVNLIADIKRRLADGSKNFLNSLILLGGGISKSIATVLGITKSIGGFIFKRPFDAIKNFFGIATDAAKKRKSAGGFGTFVSSVAEIVDGLLTNRPENLAEGAVGLASFIPGPVGKAAKVIFWGKQIMDLGSAFLGSPDNKQPTQSSNPTMTGNNTTTENTKVEANTANANFSEAGESTETQTVTLNEEQLANYNKALQFKDNPLAKGRIAEEFNKMSPENQQLFRDYAAQQGDDFSNVIPPVVAQVEPKSGIMTNKATENLQVGETNAEVQQIAQEEINFVAKSNNAQVSANSENVQAPPPKLQEPAQLSEPAPQIVPMNSGGGTQQPMVNIPEQKDPMTNVPKIASSNPENFYTLYSLHSYNVVV
jgi:hypothetical protein